MLDYTKQETSSRRIDYYPARIKQWFCYLNRQYTEADELFRQLRIFKTAPEIVECLQQARQQMD